MCMPRVKSALLAAALCATAPVAFAETITVYPACEADEPAAVPAKATEAMPDIDVGMLRPPMGDLVCSPGPSRCGQTTLLRVIAGVDETDAGRVSGDGRGLSTTTLRERNFGTVVRSLSLVPTPSAARSVASGLDGRKWHRTRIAERLPSTLAGARTVRSIR